MLSRPLKNICRKIDVVMVKGSKQPLDLYTIDVNMNPKLEKEQVSFTLKEKADFLIKKKADIRIAYFKNQQNSFEKFINTNSEFKELLKPKRGKYFYNTFDQGLEAYINGQWDNAKEYFEECKYINDEDGPTLALYKYLEHEGFKAPEGWEGCRKLTSK